MKNPTNDMLFFLLALAAARGVHGGACCFPSQCLGVADSGACTFDANNAGVYNDIVFYDGVTCAASMCPYATSSPTPVPTPATSAPTPSTSAPTPSTSAPTPSTSAPTPSTSAPTPSTSAPTPQPETCSSVACPSDPEIACTERFGTTVDEGNGVVRCDYEDEFGNTVSFTDESYVLGEPCWMGCLCLFQGELELCVDPPTSSPTPSTSAPTAPPTSK